MAADGSPDTRVAGKIDAPPPADPSAASPDAPDAPGATPAGPAGPTRRGKLRRRLRRLRRAQERRLADLGTLVYDARKRTNGSRPAVVDRRAAEAAEAERQVRELTRAVDARADGRVLATGVRGSCRGCGSVLATEDRFCPDCGTPAKPGRARPADPAPVNRSTSPPSSPGG